MRAAPCKNCEYKGCGPKHSSCEPYLEWKAESSKALQEMGKARMMDRLSTHLGYHRRHAKK